MTFILPKNDSTLREYLTIIYFFLESKIDKTFNRYRVITIKSIFQFNYEFIKHSLVIKQTHSINMKQNNRKQEKYI